jgi:hypothetical protein
MSWILWLLTTSWLAACGRLEFDALVPAPPGGPPDTATPDAAMPDTAMADAPPDNPPEPAPNLEVATALALNTQCGDASGMPAQLEVTNRGTADLVISSASVPGASPFRVTQVPPRIAPGATAMITVVPPMAIVGTDRAGTTFDDTLTLRTNAGDRRVALVATVTGANIDLQMPAGATTLQFTAASGCPAPQTVVVTNTGTAAITIDQLAANGVAFSGFSGGSIGAGTSKTTTVRPFTNGACAAVGMLGYQAASGASGLCVTTEFQVTLSIMSSSSCFCS